MQTKMNVRTSAVLAAAAFVSLLSPLAAQQKPAAAAAARAQDGYFAPVARTPGFAAEAHRLLRELRAEGIGTSVHFIPIHRHPHFRDSLGLAEGAFPVAEDAYRRAVTLPLFAGMTDRDADDVIVAVRKVAEAFRR